MSRRLDPAGTAALAGLLLVGLIGGCYKEPVALTTHPPGSNPGPGLTLRPGPEGSGAPTAACVNGWTTPDASSDEYDDALEILVEQLGIDGLWQFDSLRYFTGPDTPWNETPADVVERWYMRTALATNANIRGRFLIERRSEINARVVAVAPYESSGYQSPDWTGFVGDGEAQTYLGLPGKWVGTSYDFVSGAGFTGQPGLPDQVIGCLSDS